MEDGKKIAVEMDNPIEKYMIYLCEIISPFLFYFHFTANLITTIGLIFGLIAVYLIWKGYKASAFIFFWLGYFCDCLDGYYARRYNQRSKFGAYYDIARDWIVTSAIIIIILMKLKNSRVKLAYGIVTIILFLLMAIHMGCQEKNTPIEKQSETLKLSQHFCPNKNDIHVTRFFGSGTFILFQSIFILLT